MDSCPSAQTRSTRITRVKILAFEGINFIEVWYIFRSHESGNALNRNTWRAKIALV
jgi:hypothetical protein